MPDPADNDASISVGTKRRARLAAGSPRGCPESAKHQKIHADCDQHRVWKIPEKDKDVHVSSPKPKRRVRRSSQKLNRDEALTGSPNSTDSVQKDDRKEVHSALLTYSLELSAPEISSETRDSLLEILSSERFVRTYSERALLLKHLVQNQIDSRLLNLHPVPESVAVFFQRIFTSMQKTPSSKTKTLDRLFEQINECLSDDKNQLAELRKVLSSNAASINMFGAYMVMMLRLAALRQLESNGFDAFETLCYLIETLRQCLLTDIETALLLMADEKAFADVVKTTEAGQVQLAFSLSKYGLLLPKATS